MTATPAMTPIPDGGSRDDPRQRIEPAQAATRRAARVEGTAARAQPLGRRFRPDRELT